MALLALELPVAILPWVVYQESPGMPEERQYALVEAPSVALGLLKQALGRP